MWKEFKEFTGKGNVIDLAVSLAVSGIIGAAFGKIVTLMVEDIVVHPIGLLLGKVDFDNLFMNLSDGN